MWLWSLSPVQAYQIPGRTARGLAVPSLCHVFMVPSTWKKINPQLWQKTSKPQIPRKLCWLLPGPPSTGQGVWPFPFHALVTLRLFLGCQRKLVFQISGADVWVTKEEPDGHQRGQGWEGTTIQKKGIKTTINQPKVARSLKLTAEIKTQIYCYTRLTTFQQRESLRTEEENSKTEK